MSLQAQVLYDFEPHPQSGEVALSVGDIVTVTRQNIGDGWWEGVNAAGDLGLFPGSYVQVLAATISSPPSTLPPPLPPGIDDHQTSAAATNNGWGSSFANYENNPAPPPPPPNDDDEFADDWSDDEAPRQESAGSEKAGGGHGGTGQWQVSRTGARTHSGGQPMEAGKGTVKKNINRFSNFVKSGTEAYILDSSRPSCQPREAIQVAVGSDGVFWASNPQAYTVRVDSPKKASKLKGLKSFIAYQLTPSFNNIQVSRRYKHFDWLHARLSEKFACLLIPPLPEKQVSGRYEEDFVGHRMQLLQVWIDKICRHPVLSQSAVWQHFITCTDEKKWKSGKRAAEKDEFVGGNLFLTVQIPHQPLDMMDVESRIEGFGRMARSLDESVKGFYTMAAEAAKKMQGPYKREYLKIGAAFRSLGLSFDLDISGGSADMTDAIKRAGDSYDIIAQMFEQQPRVDLEPLMAALFAYKGMLASVPEMIVTHKSALSKLRDHQKLADEGKVNQAELEAIRSRVDVISYALLAEINHFQREKVHDFGDMLSTFLRGQVAFYQEIVNKLQSTLQLYSNYA